MPVVRRCHSRAGIDNDQVNQLPLPVAVCHFVRISAFARLTVLISLIWRGFSGLRRFAAWLHLRSAFLHFCICSGSGDSAGVRKEKEMADRSRTAKRAMGRADDSRLSTR